jgi:hypothetical protein
VNKIIAGDVVAAIVAGCGGGSGEAPANMARLGEQISRDESLSASKRMSCQTCHQPAGGHASPQNAPAESGGLALDLQETRSVTGICYLRFNVAFHFDHEGTATGDFFRDGRASSLEAQSARRRPRRCGRTWRAPLTACRQRPSIDASSSRWSRATAATAIRSMTRGRFT